MCNKYNDERKCHDCYQCTAANEEINFSMSLDEYLKSLGDKPLWVKAEFGSRFVQARAYLEEQLEEQLEKQLNEKMHEKMHEEMHEEMHREAYEEMHEEMHREAHEEAHNRRH